MREIVTFVFGLALLGNAALFVPQAIAVWRKKSDEGISLVTFGGFCILQVIGVVHGVYEHDNSLIIGLGASFLTCGTVTSSPFSTVSGICAPYPLPKPRAPQ